MLYVFMTKDQLVEKMADKCGCTKKEAASCLEGMLDAITVALQKGDKVALTGFGVFQISHRKARQGVNPKTGAKIQIPAMKAPKFRAGKSLKEAVK
ncbi:MAG: DNA-binding protein HU 1 [Parcubacteria group bacterium GW2011_GWA2_42_11]|nr:MAG: DNA-binding protein HU 1 [Parcubacteria group bacterium GW2011_GWA2_42_11]